MGLNNFGLGMIFSANDTASSVMGRVGKNFMSLEQRIQAGRERMGNALAGITTGAAQMAAGFGASFSLLRPAAKFEQGIAMVGATVQASAEELRLFEEAALKAGIATQFDPLQAAMALNDLGQAGFNARESIALLGPTLDLAAGSLGKLTPQESAGLAAQAMKAFGIETSGAAVAVDQILKAVNVFALSADEMALGLGSAGRGAQAIKQDLPETLVALGLVKNVIPSIERASTAVAVSMERLADPGTQRDLAKLGVNVTDTAGRFRPFLDVVGDLAPALSKMNDRSRAAFLLQTFGREALGGVNAILGQVTNGIRTNSGETLKGAAALAYLRGEFQRAGGTAKDFSGRLLDTTQGQLTLLKGSVSTLATTIGAASSRVIRPAVEAVTRGVNRIIEWWMKLDPKTQDLIGKVVLLASSLTMVAGALKILRGASVLAGGGLGTMARQAWALKWKLLPLVGLGAAFGVAWQRNLGGVQEAFRGFAGRARLGLLALSQAVTTGQFSGPIAAELNKAENAGVMRFVQRAMALFQRLLDFLSEVGVGFVSVMETGGPVFAELGNAASGLVDTLGEVFGQTGKNGQALAEYGSTGQKVGSVLGEVALLMVRGLTLALRLASALVYVARGAWSVLRPIFEFIGNAISAVVGFFTDLFGTATDAAGALKDNRDALMAIGKVLGGITAAWLAYKVAVRGAALWSRIASRGAAPTQPGRDEAGRFTKAGQPAAGGGRLSGFGAKVAGLTILAETAWVSGKKIGEKIGEDIARGERLGGLGLTGGGAESMIAGLAVPGLGGSQRAQIQKWLATSGLDFTKKEWLSARGFNSLKEFLGWMETNWGSVSAGLRSAVTDTMQRGTVKNTVWDPFAVASYTESVARARLATDIESALAKRTAQSVGPTATVLSDEAPLGRDGTAGGTSETASAIARMNADLRAEIRGLASRPVDVNVGLEVDGEVLAQASARGAATSAGRAFRPAVATE